MKIRPARPTDYPGLRALWHELDSLHARLHPRLFRVPRSRPAPDLSGSGRQRQHTVLLVAEATDGTLVGLVEARVVDTPRDALLVPARRGHVSELVVAPSQRRRGLARALMQRAELWCRDRGATQVLLTVWEGNYAAEALYRRLGYVPLSRTLVRDL